MTSETKLLSGIVLLTVPTIIYGGFFLLQVLSGKQERLALTTFQRSMFRAGHAHAGVIVMLSLIILLFIDQTQLNDISKWVARLSTPTSAILISGGFFGAAAGKEVTKPGKLIGLLYIGILFLTTGLIITGIGLIL